MKLLVVLLALCLLIETSYILYSKKSSSSSATIVNFSKEYIQQMVNIKPQVWDNSTQEPQIIEKIIREPCPPQEPCPPAAPCSNENSPQKYILQPLQSLSDKYFKIFEVAKMYDFKGTDWADKYYAMKNKIWDEYKKTHDFNGISESLEIEKLSNEKKQQILSTPSQYTRHSAYKGNAYLLTTTNICFNRDENNVYFFNVEPPNHNIDYVGQVVNYRKGGHGTFNSRWQMYYVKNKFNYIMMHTWYNHPVHFYEFYNFVLHYIHHPELYDPLNILFTPYQFNSRDNEWIKKYIQILESEIPSEIHHRRYDGDYLRGHQINLLCFDKVTLIGKIYYHGRLGANYYELDEGMYIRVIIYKHMNVNTQEILSTMSGSHLQINYLIRTISQRTANKGRIIQNMDDIKDMLKLWHYKINYIDFETYNFKQQIDLMVSTDILISINQGALGNIMFMMPNSGVLSISSPWASALRFMELASVTNVFYYPVLDFEPAKQQEKCKRVFSMTQLKFLKPEPCYGQGHLEKYIKINPLLVVYSLTYIEVVVKAYKYNM